MCRMWESYRGGIVVMDVIWRRLCVRMILGRMIYLFSVGKDVTSETIDVCIWRMLVFMSVVVTVWGPVIMFVV